LKKFSTNSLCPCGSKKKYKKCCQIYHKGAKAKTALEIMKSRYSAYAVGDAKYIIKTTHPENCDYIENRVQWIKSIKEFCQYTDFDGLEILDYKTNENEAFVTFKAMLSSGNMVEKSKFLKVNDIWLYHSGIFFN